jgi:Uncharacterized protein conserved in bacteria (DUF2147)
MNSPLKTARHLATYSLSLVSGIIVLGASSGSVGAQTAPPPIPAGLWRNTDDGFVMRIEACGPAFCGVAVGKPRSADASRPRDMCGKQLLSGFTWNAHSNRWEGRLQPPDMNRSIGSNIVTNGATGLTLRARMMLISKTMTFTAFTGRIGENCEVL